MIPQRLFPVLLAGTIFQFAPHFVSATNESQLLDLGLLPDDMLKPEGFPIELEWGSFENWPGDIQSEKIWTACHKDGAEVVKAANWCCQNGYRLRACGQRHSWTPLVTSDEDCYNPIGLSSNIILLKTYKLNKMKVLSNETGKSCIWTETGVLLEDLAVELQCYGLSMCTTPAPGDLTVGGTLAIDAHGTAVPPSDGRCPLAPGHSYRSLSNLVLSLCAVVWSTETLKYNLKEFKRSDKDIGPFLTCLGRAFILHVVLMAGPQLNLRCQSFENISNNELFCKDPKGKNSFSSFLDASGRVETICFAFQDCPWLKVWSEEPSKPAGTSIEVTRPYNYAFSDNVQRDAAKEEKFLTEQLLYFEARELGTASHVLFKTGVVALSDLWGPSHCLTFYVKPTTLLYHFNGYAILGCRKDVQLFLHTIHAYYVDLLLKYEILCQYPINGAAEIRVTGLDSPKDVIQCPGAQVPTMSAIKPYNYTDGNQCPYDCAIWFDVGTYLGTPHCCEFYDEFEGWLCNTFDGNCMNGVVRFDWSKGWGYTRTAPWSNTERFFKKAAVNLQDYQCFVDTMNEYDPYCIFSNTFTEKFLKGNLSRSK